MAHSTELVNRLGTLLPMPLVYQLLSAGDVFDVSADGAKGDGEANDTAAIQRTIDKAVAAGGGLVYIPKGTYKVTSSLVLLEATGVTICGEGIGATIIKGVGTFPSYTIGGTSTAANILLAGCDRCVVENLTVDKALETATINGLAMFAFPGEGDYYSTDCTFRNCEVLDNGELYRYCIWVQGGRRCQVLNCRVDGGATTPTGDSETANEGIEFYGGTDNLCDGCCVRNINGAGFNLFTSAVPAGVGGMFNMKLTNFHAENCYHGVTVTADDTGVKGMLVGNGTIKTAIAAGVQIGIASGKPFHRSKFSNIDVDTAPIGFAMSAAGTVDMQGIVLKHCSVVNATSALQSAFRVDTCQNVILDGCVAENSTNQSVRFLDSSRCRLINSRLENADAGVHCYIAGCTNIEVLNNWFGDVGASSVHLYVESNTRVYVEGNTFSAPTNNGGQYAVQFRGITGGSIKHNRIASGSFFWGNPHNFAFVSTASTAIEVFNNETQPTVLTSYGSGTAYTLTATPAAIDMGTTDPLLTLQPGTWRIYARAILSYNAATFASNRTITFKLRRTNNTAADVSNGTAAIGSGITDAAGAASGGATKSIEIRTPVAIYTTMRGTPSADADTIAPFIDVSVLPTAGDVTVTACEMIAERVPTP
jgi:hypothetical protein